MHISHATAQISEHEVETQASDLPWQTPSLSELNVSLDTQFNSGSNTDGFGGMNSAGICLPVEGLVGMRHAESARLR